MLSAIANAVSVYKVYKMSIHIKNKERKPGEFQFFMHQFVEAGIRNGLEPLREFEDDNLYIRLMRKLSPILRYAPKTGKSVIIACGGGTLYYSSRPYFRYNIIPFLWDVWPENRNVLFDDIKKLKVKLAFVTSKQNKELIEKKTGIKCHYIPEGIDVADYSKGESLVDRVGDVYELGRQHPLYHKAVVSLVERGDIRCYYGNEYDNEGRLLKLAFSTAEDLLLNINKIKIAICFPQCDTHPQRVGNIETLTQRYWECMLSGNLIVGRAPQELIDLIGYDPVVNVDWSNPEGQLSYILKNIGDYQPLVDKNYAAALKHASWDNRIEEIVNILATYGITL